MGKRRSKRETGAFAMLPVDVLISPAVRTLPHVAHRVLVALAGQYSGRDNGSLSMTRKTAATFGIIDSHSLAESLRELEERGLIVRTRPGTRVPARSAMFAITWRGIDEPRAHDPHDSVPNPIPTHAYARWEPSKSGIHWVTKKRAPRWRLPTRMSGAYPHAKAQMSGACPLNDPVSPVAPAHYSHISGVQRSVSTARRRRRSAA